MRKKKKTNILRHKKHKKNKKKIKVIIDGLSADKYDMRECKNLLKQYDSGKKWCYDCVNYYQATLCGYNESCCKKFGSLDLGQTERRPDKTANTCTEYESNGKDPWFFQYYQKQLKELGRIEEQNDD